jgi:hypothetical protein
MMLFYLPNFRVATNGDAAFELVTENLRKAFLQHLKWVRQFRFSPIIEDPVDVAMRIENVANQSFRRVGTSFAGFLEISA